jgi:hypothetical protein
MSEAVDLTRPVRTRAGNPARVLCADLKSLRPVVVAIFNGQHEVVREYPADGRYLSPEESSVDLENVE